MVPGALILSIPVGREDPMGVVSGTVHPPVGPGAEEDNQTALSLPLSLSFWTLSPRP